MQSPEKNLGRVVQAVQPQRFVGGVPSASALAAGSDELFSRDTQQAQRQQLWLDAQTAGLPELEARISRLCAWVLMADRLGVDYGLRVAGQQVPPAQGEAHRRRCLEVLATCA